MLLHDLSPGQKVSIQVELDGKHFEFPSSVIMVQGDGIYLEPYEFRGSIVDFGAASPGYLFFHLHCMDAANNERQVFKNLHLITKSFGGMKYYFATVREMNKISYSDERRKKTRFPLQGTGEIKLAQTPDQKENYDCTIHVQLVNVSERGVAFLLPPDNESLSEGDTLTIRFSDFAMEKDFDLTANCTVVRTSEHEDGILYGCHFTNLSSNMMMYLCLKSIEERIAQKEAQQYADK